MLSGDHPPLACGWSVAFRSMAVPGDTEKVKAVLLVDGWHFVKPGSFKTDFYGFVKSDAQGNTGFSFIDTGESRLCPSGAVIVGQTSMISAFQIES